jgi:diguanylate cyclase (GGDEF)-like protein/PAS domain S-box-containing protein
MPNTPLERKTLINCCRIWFGSQYQFGVCNLEPTWTCSGFDSVLMPIVSNTMNPNTMNPNTMNPNTMNNETPSLNLESQLGVLKTVTSALTLEPKEFLNVVCKLLAQVLKFPRADFAQLSSDQHEFVIVAEYRSDLISTLGRRMPLDDLNRQVMQDKKTIAISDAKQQSKNAQENFQEFGILSKLIVPVVSDGLLLGTLALDSFEPRTFDPQEIEFVEMIASLAAPFMVKTRVIAQLSTELKRGKQIEERLTLSEAGAKAILDALPDTVYRLDARGQILDVRAPGADASWMVDKHLRDIYPEAVVTTIEQALKRVQEHGKVGYLEYSLLYPTGERNLEARFAPIWSGGAILIERDITDAKHAARDLNKSRAQYRDLVENVSGVVWEAELHSADVAEFTFIGPQSQEVVGVPSEQLIGSTRPWMAMVYPDDRKLVVNAFMTAAQQLSAVEGEYRIIKPDGQVRWVQDRAIGFSEPNRPRLVRGLIVDITDRKRAQILERGRNRALEGIARGVAINTVLELILEMLIEQFPGLGAQVSLLEEGHLSYVAYRDVTDDLLECLDVAGGDPCSVAVRTGEAQFIENLGTDDRWSLEYRAALIQAGYKHCAAFPIVTSSGVILGTMTSYTRNEHWGEDLRTQQKAAADLAAIAIERHSLIQKLEYQALHDPLTSLPNRVLYHDRLHQAITRADRNGSLIGVLFIDLNGFKAVNDGLGHAVGDQLLCDIGIQLQSLVRASDTVARLGGDEFCLILPDLSDSAPSENLRQEITQNLKISLGVGQKTLTVSASVGLAIYPRDGADADALYKYADSLMYREKVKRKSKSPKSTKSTRA